MRKTIQKHDFKQSDPYLLVLANDVVLQPAVSVWCHPSVPLPFEAFFVFYLM